MNPIQPVTSGLGETRQLSGAQQAQNTQQTSSLPTTGGIAVTNSINITMVQSQVDVMLNSVGGGVQDNEMLRMIIALLIMQALLTNDQEQQQAAITSLLDSLGGGGNGRSANTLQMQSATNVIQIQAQSTVLATNQAALSPTSTGSDSQDTGSNVDLSA